jgi:DNA-binding CsgD family transcriptional regulator
MLIGRQVECDRLDQLLVEARAGRSAVLVLRGEAGIGKSALCAYAAERAGMTVLSVRAVETESELPFSGLADLLQPFLGRLDEIPGPQAAALAGALAIGPAVSGERFAACSATLSLLGAAADESAVLAIVDDAQWLDGSSLQALLFAARRLDAERIAFLFALRDGDPTPLDDLAFPELQVRGLDDDAARELLANRGEMSLEAALSDRLLALASGNPLALIEIPRLLTQGQLSGADPIGEELPRSATIERVFLRQAETLPEETRQALVVAAASESGGLEQIAAALRTLDLDEGALEPAQAAGLVSLHGGRLEFRHPLLRTGIYRTAPTLARRAAHQALAGVEGNEQPDRRAWHLASAAGGRDEAAAEALDRAALAARERGGHAEAAAALERAAALGGEGLKRATRLRRAAEDAWLLGRVDKTRELLDSALLAADDDASVRVRIQHLRAAIDMWHGAPVAARDLLLAEATAIEERDPERAARLLTDAAWACFMAGDIASGLETAERACAIARGVGGDAQTLAKAVLGIAFVLGGQPRRAVPLLTEYAKTSPFPDRPLRPDGQVLTWFEQYDQAREILTKTIDEARGLSALGALPYPLSCLSDLDFRTGRWVAAYAGAAEAVRIADETEQGATLAFALSCLSRVEAALGRADDCRSHAQQALAIAGARFGAVVAFTLSALGLLELGLGRTEEAVTHLDALARQVAERGLGEPAVVQWAPDFVEANIRSGHPDAAARTLAEFELQAEKAERTWALATAARCRGLLADDGGFDAEFDRALELHGLTATPFERARTELCLGERLRRARRRAEARAPLRSALETFDRLGAAPWADRTRTELAATGETMGERGPHKIDQLTPQELQIALIVARGATNKEAGAALFLSPKTVETHLGRVYRKLTVRSRTELAALLAHEESLAPA